MIMEYSPLKPKVYNNELELLKGEQLLRFLLEEEIIVRHEINPDSDHEEECFSNLESYSSPYDYLRSNIYLYEVNYHFLQNKISSFLHKCVTIKNDDIALLKSIDKKKIILNQVDFIQFLEKTLLDLDLKNFKHLHIEPTEYHLELGTKFLNFFILPETYRNNKEIISFYFKNNRSFNSIRLNLNQNNNNVVSSELPIILDELLCEFQQFYIFKLIFEELSKAQFQVNQTTQSKNVILEESKSKELSTYEQIYLMDRVFGLIKILEEGTTTKKHIYLLVSKLIGKNVDNIRKAIEEISNAKTTTSRRKSIDKIEDLIKNG